MHRNAEVIDRNIHGVVDSYCPHVLGGNIYQKGSFNTDPFPCSKINSIFVDLLKNILISYNTCPHISCFSDALCFSYYVPHIKMWTFFGFPTHHDIKYTDYREFKGYPLHFCTSSMDLVLLFKVPVWLYFGYTQWR